MASACTGAGSRCKSNRELRAATRALVSRGTTSYIFVCSRNILTPDCVLTRTQGNRSAEGGREKKKKKGMDGEETERWTKCRGKNSSGLPSGIIWDITMRSREQKLESRG